jgi:hypothetical protein
MGNLLGHVGFYDFSELTGVRYETLFDSIDGWNKDSAGLGSVALADGLFNVSSGIVAGAFAQAQKLITFSHWNMSWSKKRVLRANIDFNFNSGGEEDNYFSTPCKGPAMGFGLRFKSDKIVGYAADEDGIVEELTLVGGLAGSWEENHTYEIIFFPGARVQFRVDGVFKGNIATNLPTDPDEAYALIEMYLSKGNAAGHTLVTSSLLFFQDS